MKTSRFVCAVFATLMPIYVMAAAIPKTFHGEWVARDEPPKSCDDIDNKVTIAAKNYGEYELGCDVKKVTTKSNKAILINLLCGGEDGNFKDSLTLQLKDAKHLNITNQNGTEIYHRCPRTAKK